MNTYKFKNIKAQAGMTLIELTVVLLILIGLAGLTLPYVASFIGKTHNSTSADSGAVLYNALSIYQAQNVNYPGGLNVLTDYTAFHPAPISYLDNTFTNTAPGGTFSASSLPTNFSAYKDTSGGAYKSLRAAGITTISGLLPGDIIVNNDGTFTPSGSTSPAGATFTQEEAVTTILATNQVFVTDACGGTYNSATTGATAVTSTGCTPAGGNKFVSGSYTSSGIANALNYSKLANETGHIMIVLGIGPQNTAVGTTLASVPVHFGDKASLQPQLVYSRFLAAFDVDTTGVNAAKLVGIVHAPDIGDQWESLFSSISAYYSN